MTPTKGNGGNGQIRLVALVLTTAIGVGGASYGLMSGRMDDRCQAIEVQIAATKDSINKDELRMDRSEAEIKVINDRMARMETKLDTILEELRTRRR